MPFTEIPGDLFVDSNPTDALAHCVSQDLRMGKGIATIFKERFNGVAELKKQNKKVGEVAYLHRENRYIFYLITKPTAWDKPTEEDFKKSLIELRKLCEQFEVSGLSLPRIGAGLDRLRLDFVHESVSNAFEGSDISVTMYYLPDQTKK
ncbi:32578_t:CDS:1 [Gigaspora margarita]|uniref:32578_t:CDS:1 n=2 Tax=Gigaspora margarita TaxID=4874 RepID=A0ABN7V1V1_GIGMA|nr:o-acetyl-ADP-ribose deacetylase 1 [Gigaspora margarita]CAG8719138.1 32578_t:CDS:1 [Gigaspora margarita]